MYIPLEMLTSVTTEWGSISEHPLDALTLSESLIPRIANGWQTDS